METEAMDRAMDMAEKFGAKLAEIAAEHSGDAVDLAHAVARVDAAHQLIIGVVCAALSGILLRICVHAGKVGRGASSKERDVAASVAIASGLGCIVLAIVATVELASPWPWVGIIEPNIWIAKSILNL
jgi:hypothetical protein